MKPSTAKVRSMLRERDSVTTHEFVLAGAGSRFGARIGELRAMGYVISEERLPLPVRGSRYRLVGEPVDGSMVTAACGIEGDSERSTTAPESGSVTHAASLFDADSYRQAAA